MIIDDIGKLREELGVEPVSSRLWTGDVTPERLQGLLVEHGERMSVLSDEGGVFEVMSGLYTDGHSNIDVFLKAHAGSSVRVDRAGRTVYLRNPALTFGLVVQPKVIEELAQGSQRRFRGVGALARFLYCVPKSNIGTRDMTVHTPIPKRIRDTYDSGILLLLSMSAERGFDGLERPRTLGLSQTALALWQRFAQSIEDQQGEGKELDSIQDWTSKLAGAALRIAGLLHVAEHGCSSLTIDQSIMEKALSLCRLLIPHAQAAFELMSHDQSLADAKWILAWILKQGQREFKQSELQRVGRFNKSRVQRLTKAFDLLEERHIISARHELGTRKPTYVYYVNPAVFRESPIH